jgi:putative nucleotidyltransferase with HDIG domain
LVPAPRLLIHLAARFFGALDPRGPEDAVERWAESWLVPGEQLLWRAMSGPDRRHAAGVAREVVHRLGPGATRAVIAAALLHDVGKIEAQLGTVGRVPATIVGLVARGRVAAGTSRVAKYLRHDEIGADLLRDAGSDPLTVAWAREHHAPPATWTIGAEAGAALKAADDD